MVIGGLFCLPNNFFLSVWLYSIHFSSPITTCFKVEHFHYVYVKNHLQKYDQEGSPTSPSLIYLEQKHQSVEHNQAGANDFQYLIWIFWVCWLPPEWYNIDSSQCLDLHQLKIVYLIMENAAAAKSLQSCLTLCNPIEGSPPGSTVPGILLARTLKWVAISFSNAWKWKVKVKLLSHVQLFTIPWTIAYQAPPSMGFSRQQYWSGLPWSGLPLPSPTMEHSPVVNNFTSHFNTFFFIHCTNHFCILVVFLLFLK